MSNQFVVIVTVLILLTLGNATVWYVHQDSTMNCIQDCLDSCSTGDTVLVGPGTYYENIVWPGTQEIALISEYGKDTTIIDGDSTDRVISFLIGVDTTTIIDGFTIRNGYLSAEGAGIYCYGASPTIVNNIITMNASYGAGYGGGALACVSNANAIINNNEITNNSGCWGGGILCYDNSSPIISDNIIESNAADSAGGGIICWNSNSTIDENEIRYNTSPYGGGIFVLWNSNPTIANNIIDENTAAGVGGIGSGGGICVSWFGSSVISNNSISNNTAAFGGGGVYFTMSSTPLCINNTITGNISPNGAIRCRDYAAPIFKHCDISNNNSSGASILQCTPTFDSCTIANNQNYGIICSDNVDASVNYCNIYGHTSYGIYNPYPADTIDAENNWWGDATGPYNSTLNPGGLGDPVSDYVDFDPWLTSQPGIAEYVYSAPVELYLQVTPNPFSKLTQIRCSIPNGVDSRQKSEVSIKIYDATGSLVKSFYPVSRIQNQESVLVWDGTDQNGRQLGSGVYFVQLSTGDQSCTVKLLLMR